MPSPLLPEMQVMDADAADAAQEGFRAAPSSSSSSSSSSSVPAFASAPPFKKRKFIRRRLDEAGSASTDAEPIPATSSMAPASTAAVTPVTAINATSTTSTTPSPPPIDKPTEEASEEEEPAEKVEDKDSGENAPNLSEILRLRKKIVRTSTRRGLEVTVTAPRPTHPAVAAAVELVPSAAKGQGQGGSHSNNAEDDAAAIAAAEEAELQAVVNRFTHQTGQILDVDKHMMAYIDSEMQRRRGIAAGGGAGGASQGGGGSDGASSMPEENTSRSGAYWTPVVPEGRGATLGKLHEVDLGEETKKRNIARTQEATRRLAGDGSAVEGEEEEEAAAGGEGGKKKMKGRRRRNSQDIQRDKLVEEVLKESRLEMYTEPDPTEEARETEGAADDRIAEKFRREFLDALMSRRRRRGGDPRKKRDETKKPRGPKLGGSRQARAAMRESQNQAAAGGGGGVKKR